MPANRSRTLRWRETLRDICSRGGGIEISLRGEGSSCDEVADLVWRVRLLEVSEEELVVEMPAAFGQTIPLPSGAAIVGAMSIGQNRWMFHSRVIGIERIADRSTRAAAGLRLHAPDRVERCLRRDAYRVSTASLSLPPVECWPLLDPTSAIAAEVANRALVRELERAPEGDTSDPPASSWTLPEVGAKFEARLANVSGGGLGLVLDADQATRSDRAGLLWMRIDLRPTLVAPIGVTARQVHSHRDSAQRTHIGCAFEFQFNPSHRAFICEQIGRYVERVRTRSIESDAA